MTPDSLRLWKVAVVLALVVSPFAAGMSYLITYQEYVHHFRDKRQAFWIAFRTAGAAFSFFVVLTLGIFFFLAQALEVKS